MEFFQLRHTRLAVSLHTVTVQVAHSLNLFTSLILDIFGTGELTRAFRADMRNGAYQIPKPHASDWVLDDG